MTNKFIGYRCSICGKTYSTTEVEYVCPSDGGNLDIILDYEAIQKFVIPDNLAHSTEESLWRYLPLLPVNNPGGEGTPLHAAGWTPIYSPPALSTAAGLDHLWIKDESRNPTASFKDRASAIVVARAREIKADVIVTASTGNAGAALAGMAAAIGQKAVIFAPRSAPPAKIAQLLIFGAQVLLVEGTYDDAFDLSIQASQEFGWYCRNTGYNPFTAEGKKTAAFEIWEWSMHTPAWKGSESYKPALFVSVGDGNIISGIHKGFKDLFELGWLDVIPRIFGVQADGSAAIANAFWGDSEEIIPVKADTLADSISVDLPRDGIRAIRAAKETGGSYILVSDEEILSAISALGKVGIFAEPAGATSYAGMVKALHNGVIDQKTPVLVMNTGSGLKDISAAMKAVHNAPIIEPTIKAVKQIINDQ
jgi:threonine synthase